MDQSPLRSSEGKSINNALLGEVKKMILHSIQEKYILPKPVYESDQVLYAW
jgi:hypothetical protein